jgi:Kef-type K+ transport system membrane component KefB
MLDVAELDDISGIALLALLFAVLPYLAARDQPLGPALMAAAASFAARVAAFAGLCYLFARYAEPRVTALSSGLRTASARMLLVTGSGFVIAATAEGLGLSLAVGALFAGIAFSRDPVAVRVEARFDDLYAFFVPFFFIGIGLSVEPGDLTGSLVPALILLAAAIAGKLLGGGIPALGVTSAAGALAIGTSLVPRAEIALYVARQAHEAGSDVLPARGYAALVLVALATTLIAPLALRPLLGRAFAHAGTRP